MSDPNKSSLSTFEPSGSRFIMNSKNMKNPELIAEAIASGYLTPDALNNVPSSNVISIASNTMTGVTPLGNGANVSKVFTVNPQLKTFVPNSRYNSQENLNSGITGETEVIKGIPLGTFMGGTARQTDISTIPNEKLSEILKYLVVQGEALYAARNRKEFNKYRITVEEGIYQYQDTELEEKDDLASLASKGRAIGYVVKDFRTGNTSKEMTFLLAQYFASYPFHDKIILDYHTYSTLEDIGMRVFLTLPELDNNFEGSWSRKTETRYNGRSQSESLVLLG